MARRHDTVQENALLGAVVGLASSGSFSVALGAGPVMVVFAIALGFVAGFVVGILIWLETADLPSDRIPLRVAEGEKRRKRSPH